jgi:hypothetical protein
MVRCRVIMDILVSSRAAAAHLADARVKMRRRIQSASWLMMIRVVQGLLMLIAIIILSLFAEVVVAV